MSPHIFAEKKKKTKVLQTGGQLTIGKDTKKVCEEVDPTHQYSIVPNRISNDIIREVFYFQ